MQPSKDGGNDHHRRLMLRRLLQGAVGSVALGAGLLGWATCIEPHWFEITERELPIPNLPKSLIGKRLIQVSDFHIGKTSIPYLASAIEAVNRLDPDILVLTGDFIDHGFPEAPKMINAVFGELKPATYATIGCLGNHDYGRFWSEIQVADGVVERLKDHGVRILLDEQVQIEGLDIFGLNDFWSPRYQANKLMRRASPTNASICLCHNPDVCDNQIWGDFQGVILAGHTHGGQCKPPFLDPPRVPVRNGRYVSGFYDLGDERTLYINRGIGHGLKARFNCRPEITVFTLSTKMT